MNRLKLYLFALLIAIFLVACGGEEADTPEPQPTDVPAQPTSAPAQATDAPAEPTADSGEGDTMAGVSCDDPVKVG